MKPPRLFALGLVLTLLLAGVVYIKDTSGVIWWVFGAPGSKPPKGFF